MESENSKIIRIVNVQRDTTENELKKFIQQTVGTFEKIANIYVGRDYKRNLNFAYVIFESNIDAVTNVEILNGSTYGNSTLEVELIVPNGNYKRYKDDISHSLFNFRKPTDPRPYSPHSSLLSRYKPRVTRMASQSGTTYVREHGLMSPMSLKKPLFGVKQSSIQTRLNIMATNSSSQKPN